MISKRAIDKFAKYSKASARAADRIAIGDPRIDRILHRRAFPAADVIGLVAAGDEYHLRLTNNLDYRWILRRLAIRNDERCHRIQFAQSVDIGVIGVGSGG